MSEDEGFLARWSRRKRQADEPAASTPAPLAAAEPRVEDASRNAEAAPVRQAEGAVPSVDLTKLPSLESITAGTDIRDFLAVGVPETLKRAALRRAWAADPAIRDFVGLSENAWDFTAPDGIPGFGPMLPTDDVARMVAQVIRDVERPELAIPDTEASSKPESSASEPGTADDSRCAGETTHSHTSDESNSPVSLPPADRNSATGDKTVDIAAQKDSIPVRREHGGALPQ